MARIPTVTAEKSIDVGERTMPRLDYTSQGSRAVMGMGDTLGQIAEREAKNSQNIEDFVTDQRYQQHVSNMTQRLDEARRNAPEGAIDLAAKYNLDLQAENKKWVETEGNVPTRLRERYDARLGTLGTVLGNKAADFEYEDRNKYYTQKITAGAGQLGANVANNPDSLLTAREGLFGQIDNSSLPAAEKAAMKSRHGMTLAKAGVDGLIRQERYDEARELASSVAGIGRGSAQEGGPIVMDDQKRAARDTITRVAKDMGMSPDTVMAVATLESGLNPGAINGKTKAIGLFQIMPKEAAENGMAGGDIETQVRYGVARLQRDAKDLEGRGIPVNPATLYLAHFQGPGAAEKLLKADPNAPLRDTLDAARPGWTSKDGKSWGELVIEQNNIKADSTTGQFLQGITRKVNGAMIAVGATEAGFTERAALVDQTDTWIKSDENRRKTEQRENIRQTKNLVDNDIASIQQTGVEVGELSEKRVADHLGAEAGRQWIIAREQARRQFELTKDLDSLPAADIQRRVSELAADVQKASGTAGFNGANQIYEAAYKKAERISKLREEDPARAVESDKGVKAALSMLNTGNAQTVQNLVGARYAAQEAVGIPPNARSPITNQEGRELAAVLEGALPNERAQVLRRMVTEVQVRYGEYADDVLKMVAGQFVKDREVRDLAGGILRKLGNGQNVPLADQARGDRAIDADRAQQAITGQTGGFDGSADPNSVDPRGSAFRAQKPDPATMTEIEKHRVSFNPSKPIDLASWQRLTRNPEIAPAFDAEFGPGASQWVLKANDLVMNRGDRKRADDGANPAQ